MRKRSATYRSLVWLFNQKTYKVVLVFGVAFLAVLLAGLSPFLLAADTSANGRFPARVSIGGVDVGNLTRAKAISRCEKGLAGIATAPLTLMVDGEPYSISPAGVGLELDYRDMVDQAYRRAWNVNIVERVVRRFLGKPKAMNLPVLAHYDEQKVAAFVKGAMGFINRPPRNAYMDVSSGNAVVVTARDGLKVDSDQVLAATRKCLDAGEREAEVPLVKRTPPRVKDITMGKFILVNLGEHTLSLYDRDTLLGRYPVATGSKQWPTCIGEWAVVKGEKNPTWYNRGSTWADNMPASLPPGPNNPLGTRAITINGGGVLIHGTSDTGSIGYSASHGCIRMYMRDVEALFEHVYIGMPVYIIKRSGEPGFDCSKKAFWKD